MRPVFRSLALAAVLAVAPAAPAAAQAQDMVGQFEIPGDAVVITAENHAGARVVIDTWIRAGSAQDPAGTPGLAWVTARTLWAGGKAGLLADVRALGGEGAVEVDREFTHFQVRLPAAKLEAGVKLIGESFAAPDWDGLGIEGAVRAGREALERLAADPEASAFEAYMSRAYRADYGHPVAGDPAGLGKIGKADVRAFFERYYVPGRLRVVLAGDLDTGKAVGMVVSGYAAVLKRVAAMDAAATPAPAAPSGWRLPDAAVIAGVKGADVRAVREHAALEMVGHVMKARLEGALGEPNVAKLVDVKLTRLSVASPLIVTITAKPEAAAAVEGGLRAAFDDMRQNPVRLEEHARAQAAVAQAATIPAADLPGRARGLGFAATVAGSPNWLRTYPDIVRQVSRQEMLEAVQKYASPTALTIVTVSR